MKPHPPDDPAELLHRLREQLILAQVRIMELEDVRDEAVATQAELEALLKDAQGLADAKIDALTHLERVHADLQAQFQHLRHMQHVTNEALNETRAQLQESRARLQAAEQQDRRTREEIQQLQEALAARQADIASLQAHASERGRQLAALDARARQLDAGLAEVNATAAARLQRLNEVDAEIRAMKASRSWRWSQPIRAVERWLARRRAS